MVLVVGKNSFIAREFLSMMDPGMFRDISHRQLTHEVLKGINCIINFAFAPEMHRDPYQEGLDIDLQLAKAIIDLPHIHYVMISSRKVYAASCQWNANEEDLVDGLDNYGKNKLRIERKLTELLGSRLTILRPGNVFGYEIDSSRNRFGSYLLRQLAENKCIRLTVSPAVRRDIVPVDYFCEVLDAVVRGKPTGIFNVGSGSSQEIGKIASWLIEGYGEGKMVIENPSVTDEFQLDVAKLHGQLGFSCNTERIANFTRNLGGRLREEHANE